MEDHSGGYEVKCSRGFTIHNLAKSEPPQETAGNTSLEGEGKKTEQKLKWRLCGEGMEACPYSVSKGHQDKQLLELRKSLAP